MARKKSSKKGKGRLGAAAMMEEMREMGGKRGKKRGRKSGRK